MIIGIGTDIVEVNRIMTACEKKRFLHKYFSEAERQIFQIKSKSVAGNFAVKEAVSKMLGTGFRGFGPIDIEVLRDSSGKPYVILHNEANNLANNLGIDNIHVSITDTNDYAVAFVVGESNLK